MMDNLSLFIKLIFEAFLYKFENNDIFKKEKYEIAQQKDIDLIRDFIFFLNKFNFIELRKMKLFSVNWKETFYQTPFNIENYKMENVQIKLNNNDLNIIFPGGKIDLINIDNYCSNLAKIIKFRIETFGSGMDIFEKEVNLKMDKIFEKIFLKSHWDELSDYISGILCSETMKTIYQDIYGIPMIIKDKNQIKKILNNVRFFNYRTNFVAETKNKFLYIYIRSILPEEYPTDINQKTCIYLIIFLTACIHEIIGHLFLRIYNYLNKDKKQSSPMPKNPSNYAKKRQKESGEYIEEMLFGNSKYQMTMKEILFALDKNNYNVNYKIFRKNFDSINEQKNEISEELKQILELYEINLEELNLNSIEKFSLNKASEQYGFQISQYHSISQIDSDDD